jgi:hypothetical protein
MPQKIKKTKEKESGLVATEDKTGTVKKKQQRCRQYEEQTVFNRGK